ncbi:MAG: alpha/beta fold hydrolase [Verrucomicrobiota bacterium]
MRGPIKIIGLVYGLLLFLSQAVLWLQSPKTSSTQPVTIETLHESKANHPNQSPKFIEQPILIFHGISGVRSEDRHLAQALLASSNTILLPDLYTLSTPDDDQSFTQRISQLHQFIGKRSHQPMHLIAIGHGGPAAIAYAERFPSQVASLSLIGASGLQEFELLGDYSLNRVLYSLQSGIFWAIRNLTPNFGLFDRLPLQQKHFRALADVDLRPVEGQLKSITCPTLVVHGRRDYLIPNQAAKVHHQMLPQSQFMLIDGGHNLLKDAPQTLEDALKTFLLSVETRTFQPSATDAALAESYSLDGKRFWFLVGVIFVGTKFSEDLATVAAGLLVSQDVLPFWAAIVACFFGIMSGDVTIYFIGRIAGIEILRKRPFSWIISEQNVLDAQEWFEHRGMMAIVLSRFIPATRFPVYMATGILGVPPLKFCTVLSLAALVWTPLIIALAAALGTPILNFVETYERWSLPILIGFFVTLSLTLRFLVPLITRRGRRDLYRKWVRCRQYLFSEKRSRPQK